MQTSFLEILKTAESSRNRRANKEGSKDEDVVP
jgi:hypothetical protein